MTNDRAHQVSTQLLPDGFDDLCEAWNAHDVDRIMSHIHHNCLWLVSYGSGAEGQRCEGATAIRDGLARFFAKYPDGEFSDMSVFLTDGERLAVSWIFSATVEGQWVSKRGCDLLEYADGKLIYKNAFRKEYVR
ncbi:nuclear transport factor 2 family protein (plasmid) [Arthrobacter sp. D3-18]